jgi:glutathione S-transferase
VVSESGAILLYLARKSGKLMPRDLAGEAQVLRWSLTALTTIELPVLSLWFVNLTGGKDSKPSEALHGWADMRLKQLDGWLTDRQFIATDDFTVADILMTHVLDAGTRQEMLRPYSNLLAYRARCTGRPAWRKTLDAYFERVEAA